jgi:O-acetyl-ADP-ribose deacetylase (regulator of RNase III)
MLTYTKTIVFNTNSQTLVNTVNCCGVMGAGLALDFALRFPEMEKDYIQRCDSNDEKRKVRIGRPYLYREYHHPWIMNFPTKTHWKFPSQIEWIEQGLKYFVDNYKRGKITSISFPKLGCGKGGLKWIDVNNLMEKYLCNLDDIEIIICLDEEEEASGIEAEMLSIIEKDIAWKLDLKLGTQITEAIEFAIPIKRFRYILNIKGVGKKTYKKLFRYCYLKANCQAEQLKLF